MKFWNNMREFLIWLTSWAGDTTFSLNWNCSKCESHLIIPFTDLNSRQREILDDRIHRLLENVEGITIGITEDSYTIYCKGL
jgi:hypothetical protein